MKPRDLAMRFLSKSSQDELVLDKLINDHDIADEVWGFHAQQAAEKMIKAVLSYQGIRFRKTHDITELMDLLIDNGIAMPEHLSRIRELTPFAVEYRYDNLFSENEENLNREDVRGLITEVKLWVEKQIGE